MLTLFAMIIILACYAAMAWYYAKTEGNMHIDMYVEIARINEQKRRLEHARCYVETLRRGLEND